MTPILGIMASQISGHLSGSTSFDSIATVTLSSNQSSISFTSIPSNYKHLQIRGVARTTRAGPADMDNVVLNFNSDTGSNYSNGMYQNYGAATSYSSANQTQTYMELSRIASSYVNSSTMGGIIIDILDYANTNKYKTVRALSGISNNGSGAIAGASGNWRNTNAISSIQITAGTGPDYTTYTSFALYGIRG